MPRGHPRRGTYSDDIDSSAVSLDCVVCRAGDAIQLMSWPDRQCIDHLTFTRAPLPVNSWERKRNRWFSHNTHNEKFVQNDTGRLLICSIFDWKSKQWQVLLLHDTCYGLISVCLSVCLSQAGVRSKRLNWSDMFSAQRYSQLIIHLVLRKFGISKNKDTSFVRNVVLNSELSRLFCFSLRYTASVVSIIRLSQVYHAERPPLFTTR